MQPHQAPTAAPPDGVLTIGAWRVAPDLNQIARGTDVVHLEPKAMAVLVHLAHRPGVVASRDELLAAAWPGVIVGDNALTQVIIKLRKALGDTAREPAYIQAIAKKGYRLIAPVQAAVHSAASAPVPAATPTAAPSTAPDRRATPPTTAPVPPATPAPRRTRWTAAAVAVAILLGALVWLAQRDGRPITNGSAMRVADVAATPTPTLTIEAFQAVSPEPQQTFIARAITADLVTDLSKVTGLSVVGGTRPGEAPSSAGRTPARYTLSGTVQQDGGRLRLNVSLADVLAGRQLWSERFDRDFKDIFEVQDDLVRRILDVLPVKVSEAETMRLAQRYTRNPEAYEFFLRGQAALLVRRRAQIEAARQLYWQAIGVDPAFSRAYAGLALTYALEYQQGWSADAQATLNRAFELAQTAVQMSPEMPEASWVVAFVHTQRRQHDEALRNLDDALRLNPSFADAYALKGGILTYVGRPAEGVALLRTALRHKPDAGSLYFLLLGRAYYFLGDTEQAKVNLDQALTRNAEDLEARIYLAAVHALAGEPEAAHWQANEVRALEPNFDAQAWLATYPMTDTRQKERLIASLRGAGLWRSGRRAGDLPATTCVPSASRGRCRGSAMPAAGTRSS